MPYLDPYQLLQLEVEAPSEIEPAMLKRAQRKLLAEFELSGEAVVKVHGVELDKSTALKLVEELRDPDRAALHWQVHQDRQLQLFLKEPTYQHPDSIPDLQSGPFQDFIGPYIAAALDRFFQVALREKEFSLAAEGVDRLTFLRFKDQEEAIRSVRIWLEQRLEDLEEWSENIKEVDFRSEPVRTCLNKRLIFFLNSLPDRYQTWRNRYALALLKFSLPTVNERKMGPQAFLAIEAANQLILDERPRRRVAHVYKQLVHHREKADFKKDLSPEKKKVPFLQGCFLVWMLISTLVVVSSFFTGMFKAPQTVPKPDRFYTAGLRENGLLWQRRKVLLQKIEAHSLEDRIVPKPESIPERPYQPYMTESLLAKPWSPDFDKLLVKNDSRYMAVVFVSLPTKEDQYEHYFLPPGEEEDSHPYPKGTVFQFYLGEEWQENAVSVIIGQDRQPTLLGAFAKPRHVIHHDPGQDDQRFVFTVPKKPDSISVETVRTLTVTNDSLIFRRDPVPSP